MKGDQPCDFLYDDLGKDFKSSCYHGAQGHKGIHVYNEWTENLKREIGTTKEPSRDCTVWNYSVWINIWNNKNMLKVVRENYYPLRNFSKKGWNSDGLFKQTQSSLLSVPSSFIRYTSGRSTHE